MRTTVDLTGSHVVFFSWRDTKNPEAGGAELYLEKVARGLLERGAAVTIFCAAHGEAPDDEVVDGLRFVRRGSKLTVYLRGLLALTGGRFGRVDAVVDVQNGVPFLTRAVTRKPVMVLVHHVHREQWPVIYPGLMGRVGWWIESRLSPRLYRRCQYVAVSRATRDELVALGVGRDRIAIVHNGTEPVEPCPQGKTAEPLVCTVGRVVPHKQVEHAVDACVRLRQDLPDLRLVVAGSGWWAHHLNEYIRSVGADSFVTLEGHVTEERKQEIYSRAWVHALPSLKEGWGLVVGEAGMHGTPTVAYRSAGGTRESIVDGVSGMLAEDPEDFVSRLRLVLTDRALRESLAQGARGMSDRFTWGHAQGSFARVVAGVLTGRTVSSQDPDEQSSVRVQN